MALDDLAILANALHEKQFGQIFTIERLRPLVSALLTKASADKDQQLLLAEMLIKQAITIQPFVQGRAGQIDIDGDKATRLLERAFEARKKLLGSKG